MTLLRSGIIILTNRTMKTEKLEDDAVLDELDELINNDKLPDDFIMSKDLGKSPKIKKQTSPKATEIWFDKTHFFVRLSDNRIIGTPIEWFPKLHNATKEQRKSYEISHFGIHWEEADEDIAIAGLL